MCQNLCSSPPAESKHAQFGFLAPALASSKHMAPPAHGGGIDPGPDLREGREADGFIIPVPMRFGVSRILQQLGAMPWKALHSQLGPLKTRGPSRRKAAVYRPAGQPTRSKRHQDAKAHEMRTCRHSGPVSLLTKSLTVPLLTTIVSARALQSHEASFLAKALSSSCTANVKRTS